MIGQKDLIKKIQSYSFRNFPHTVLLVGESGCGKHTLVSDIIAPHLKLDVVDITDGICLERILDIQTKAVPCLYLINTSKLTDKEQNVILKFIEEPMSTYFIVLLAESIESLIDTIPARCTVFNFGPYSKEELCEFIDDKSEDNLNAVLSVVSTPSQAKMTNSQKLIKMKTMCEVMVSKISTVAFDNLISQVDKINCKEDEDKFDGNVFLNLLEKSLMEDYIQNNNQVSSILIYKVKWAKRMFSNTKLNREMLISNLFTSMWKIAREYNGNNNTSTKG